MWRVALKNLAARKLRLALTLLTIVLGIAFITGTFVFTDSLQKQFNDLVSVGGPDIAVTPASPLADVPPEFAPAQTMDADVVDQIAAIPGVASVDPGVTARDAYVLDSGGAAVTLPGAPALGLSWPADPELSGIKVERGAAPRGRDEVALLATTAERAEVSIGDPVAINTPEAGTVHPEVVGLVSRRLTGSAGGTLAMFDLAAMQEYFTGPGLVTSVDVMVDPGSASDEVAAALRDELGEDFTVATAEETADELAQSIAEAFSFIDRFLLVFGLIALFVSTFLIFNTFSMLVAQRSRELALLRAVGATRGQVRGSVILEALVLGLLASTLGLGLGIAVSQLLRFVVGALGFDLPPGPLVVAGRTILLAYVVGIVVTTLSAMLPARRASSVAPVAAMRADVAPTHAS
ncbi:MAG: FtsX-like permease family protein, partial [Candidatus Nanopelagicales bacterium]